MSGLLNFSGTIKGDLASLKISFVLIVSGDWSMLTRFPSSRIVNMILSSPSKSGLNFVFSISYK